MPMRTTPAERSSSKRGFGTEIIASKTDALAIEGGSDEELGLDIARGPIYPLDYKYIHCKVDRTIDDQEEIEVGNKVLKFIVVPGHTLGAMCVLEKNEHVLFPGDVVFYNGTIGLGS
jgi:glyoxylase-like metal-dependent hydrolase (beta-lactamase superfamily II)